MTPTNTPRDVPLPDGHFFVEIFLFSDCHVKFRMGPMTYRSAQKVRDGAMINMNTDKWGCWILPLDAPGEATPQAYADMDQIMGGNDTREDAK